ncbi:MAG: outer membrane lipoprotein-sorting protein [Bacteroidales bacterium]|nr:outer membrane lipoprotein-sorting protein [Bacteroidales bacterium]
MNYNKRARIIGINAGYGITAMIMVMFIILIVQPASGQSNEEAVRIMKISRDAVMVNSFEAVSLLTITDENGRTRERRTVTASKSYGDGTEKRIIKFLYPPEVEGTTLLIYDHDDTEDEMWIYLPAFRKTRRIVSTEKGKSFMGSEFANSDLTSPPVTDFTHTIAERIPDQDLVKIKSVPATIEVEKNYGYAARLTTLKLSDYTAVRMEFYDKSNGKLRTIEISDYQPAPGGKFIISSMNVVNHINGRSSKLVMSEVVTGTEVSDRLFDLSALGR